MNFFGGPGESHHKYFVKAPGENTQRRVSEFVSQVARRVYEGMVLEMAMEVVKRTSGVQAKCEPLESDKEQLEGLYTLTITPLAEGRCSFDTKWNAKKKNKPKKKKFHVLHDDVLNAIERRCSDNGLSQSCEVRRFTEMKTIHNGNSVLFRASPWYRGTEWYDFGMV